MLFVIIVYLIATIIYRKRPICFIAFSMQLLSAIAAYSISVDLKLDSITDLFNLCFSIAVTFIIILPWRFYTFKNDIIVAGSPNSIKKITSIIICVSLVVLLVFSIISFIVYSIVENVDEFKYEGGQEILLSTLPIPGPLLTLASFAFPLSFLLIPLFYYYVYIGNRRLSILCIIGSLGSIVYGLSFFSRWLPLCYALCFIAFYFLLHGLLPNKLNKYIKRFFILLLCIMSVLFLKVTYDRFGEDTNNAKSISNSIPVSSYVQAYI